MTRTNAGIFMLKEMKDKLPPSERKIAEFILNQPEKAISMTAAELGKATTTSSAAVIRMCKSLNIKGIQELKLRIAGDLQRNTKEVDLRDIEPNESCISTIEKMTSHSIQTIQETADLLDTGELARAVEVLLSSEKIHFFGVGASSITALDAQQKFLRINKAASSFTDLHMGATAVANATEKDVVMGISFSGETYEVAKILQLAKDRGATTISLTKYGSSIVTEYADIRLYTSTSKEATFRSGATSSRLAQLHALDILFMCVASQAYDEAVTYLDSTRDAISSLHDDSVKKKKK
ncbi:DNA-binding MurR/RpiR family transcriptional regulator [Salirhabdus euzebyi]|uniref:DNA-binding MurR/RpiR family transcriptional regulator n=1 Tax=Salirhabdus euzebyi TaxID=394506 RepID=A0A841Q135_9BACI|nr:MurR/RpiR family transcriptional regulator [Salirhabdus euzebyi]MBB6451713.1 DNA-binding MurR/RpiR family transcriptional regulator [Salirhabdus euzebyi]